MPADLIALIHPALLESKGHGHRPPSVRRIKHLFDGEWSEWMDAPCGSAWGQEDASPLWIDGAPCWPAIDAAVTAAEAAADWQQPANRWDHWRRIAKGSRVGCLDFAREAARLLSCPLVNLEPE